MTNFSCAFLYEDDKIELNQAVTYEEIKVGLWALEPFKALGVDELHAGFFQLFWNEVSELVCKEVGNIFSTRVVLEYSNKTLIALIPKCSNRESINNYMPISLCNSVYIIVTKVIIAWLRPLLSSLISPVQAAFVPRRKGLDNIIIA